MSSKLIIAKIDYSPKIYYFDKESFQKNLGANYEDNKNGEAEGFSPMSGSEPSFSPKTWNLKDNIKLNHNCFSYAINALHSKRKGKPQPGYFSGFNGVSDTNYKCDNFYKRLIRDIPSMYLESFNKPCKPGFFKVFFALDPKSDPDYHFYRQDDTGYWSHKPGRTEITDIDASKKKIINPKKANRSYDFYKYTTPCFYFCVNPKLARSHAYRPHKSNRFLDFF